MQFFASSSSKQFTTADNDPERDRKSSRPKSPPKRGQDEEQSSTQQPSSHHHSKYVPAPENPAFKWTKQDDAIIEPVDILMYKQDAKRGTLSAFSPSERRAETLEFAWQEREFQQHVDFHMRRQNQAMAETGMKQKSKDYAQQVEVRAKVKAQMKVVAKESDQWCSNNLRTGSESDTSSEEEEKVEKKEKKFIERHYMKSVASSQYRRREPVKKTSVRGFFVAGVIKKEESFADFLSQQKSQSHLKVSGTPDTSSYKLNLGKVNRGSGDAGSFEALTPQSSRFESSNPSSSLLLGIVHEGVEEGVVEVEEVQKEEEEARAGLHPSHPPSLLPEGGTPPLNPPSHLSSSAAPSIDQYDLKPAPQTLTVAMSDGGALAQPSSREKSSTSIAAQNMLKAMASSEGGAPKSFPPTTPATPPLHPPPSLSSGLPSILHLVFTS